MHTGKHTPPSTYMHEYNGPRVFTRPMGFKQVEIRIIMCLFVSVCVCTCVVCMFICDMENLCLYTPHQVKL